MPPRCWVDVQAGRSMTTRQGRNRTTRGQAGTRYLACEQTDSVTAVRGLLEARARAAVWLSPTWNVGVQAGSSLMNRDAWTTGVYFGAHSHAFGGGR